MYKKLTIFSIIFVIVDQLIKLIISNFFSYQSSINIVPNFFFIINVHNDGAAWSILSGNVILLALLGVIALVLIYYFFLKDKTLSKLETFLYSLLIGGIIGNLIDRIFLGYVVDYIGVVLINYYFPIFNFADIGIVISILMMIILGIKEEYACKKLK